MHRTRQKLMMLREMDSAFASEVVANGKLRRLWWKPSGCHFVELSAGGREVARAAQAQGLRTQAWDTTFAAKRLNLCRSAVRSRLKRDIKRGRVLAVCLTPSRGATLMPAQMSRCHCLLFLVQPWASLLWQAPTCESFPQYGRYSEARSEPIVARRSAAAAGNQQGRRCKREKRERKRKIAER